MKIINSFPDYEYVSKGPDGKPHNYYRGEDVGFGGYVYFEPGIYKNVAVLDSVSHHPSSIIAMNYFGEYTPKYKELVDARVLIKHGEFDKVREMFDGKLKKYLKNKEQAKQLSYALKIVLNSCYGLSSASFENPMRHPDNVNNIVALRGGLFIIDLKNAVQKKGFSVIHCKTDSIKIPNATPEIIEFVMAFGKEYGYTMELEDIYEKFCLVTKADFVAKNTKPDKDGCYWKGVGEKFIDPYVFKTLFSKKEYVFKDFCETKSATTCMYLDFNERLGENEHNYVFVGKVSSFVPIQSGCNGGILVREQKMKEGENTDLSILADGFKAVAVSGSSGYRWKERHIVLGNGLEDQLDMNYWHDRVDNIKKLISQFGDVEEFLK